MTKSMFFVWAYYMLTAVVLIVKTSLLYSYETYLNCHRCVEKCFSVTSRQCGDLFQFITVFRVEEELYIHILVMPSNLKGFLFYFVFFQLKYLRLSDLPVCCRSCPVTMYCCTGGRSFYHGLWFTNEGQWRWKMLINVACSGRNTLSAIEGL